MTGKTRIGWTDYNWNPTTGCKKISPGCLNCYADEQAERLQRFGQEKYRNGFKFTVHPDTLNYPLTIKKPGKFFVNSMSDLGFEDMPQDFFNAVMDTMVLANWHIFQILTKRPSNLKKLLDNWGKEIPDHIWIGVSVENAAYKWRISMLTQIKCKVHFLSVEPQIASCNWQKGDLDDVEWLIDGAESGAKRRPYNLDWARENRDQCLALGIAYYHKQGSHRFPGMERELDGKTWDEFPTIAITQ